MTYEYALEWAEENVDPLDFDNWQDYIDAVDAEFRNPFTSFMPESFIDDLHQFYDDAHKNTEIEESSDH